MRTPLWNCSPADIQCPGWMSDPRDEVTTVSCTWQEVPVTSHSDGHLGIQPLTPVSGKAPEFLRLGVSFLRK